MSSLRRRSPGSLRAISALSVFHCLPAAHSPTVTPPLRSMSPSSIHRSAASSSMTPTLLAATCPMAKDKITIVGVVGNVAKRPGVYADAPLSTEPVFYIPAAQADPQLVVDGQSLVPAQLDCPYSRPNRIDHFRYAEGACGGRPHAYPSPASSPCPTFSPRAWFTSGSRLRCSTALAGLALLLSAIGIYGLVSSLVVQRTREIGIRIALGSTFGNAMITIGASGVVATAFGLAAGLAGSLLATRVLRSQLYGVRNHDPVTLIAGSRDPCHHRARRQLSAHAADNPHPAGRNPAHGIDRSRRPWPLSVTATDAYCLSPRRSQLLHFLIEETALRAYRNTTRQTTLIRKRDHNISSVA